MRIWNSTRRYLNDNVKVLLVCVLATVVLFLVMHSELPFTELTFSVVTVFVVARAYIRDKKRKAMLNKSILLEKQLEAMRYGLVENRNNILLFGDFGMELFERPKVEEQYYRLFCGFFEAYSVLGSQTDKDVTDMLGSLQNAIIKDYDLQKRLRTELSGLRWIILAAIPTMPLVRLWVTANMNEMDLYYREAGGVLVKYGIWSFTLFIFLLFERLGEIKSDAYI